MKKALAIILAVLCIDQGIKIWIKTHMTLGESYRTAGNWFHLHFVENPGMAFGLEFTEGATGKLVLSIFRIVAVAGIAYYLFTLFKKQVRPLLIVCVSLILAGALGNIIDSAFYGMIFDKGTTYDPQLEMYLGYGGVAQVAGQGYSSFLHGCVVDMFYFPVYKGEWGGDEVVFFRPVFNIADASISVGVFLLIIFQRRLYGVQEKLSERKILASNTFFGVVVFLISTFLSLTLLSMFGSTHPLGTLTLTLAFLGSAALGYGFFRMLQREPVYTPAVVETELPTDTDINTSADNTATESISEEVKTDEQKTDQENIA
ncbi:MAG: lipoprotein signal peptidase [Bacteroidia bacterium]